MANWTASGSSSDWVHGAWGEHHQWALHQQGAAEADWGADGSWSEKAWGWPKDEDWQTEWLAVECNVKVVDDIAEAIDHVNKYGSCHTDAIVTESPGAADAWVQGVDSAGVYVNCSTRFADGFRYGFGAEVAESG